MKFFLAALALLAVADSSFAQTTPILTPKTACGQKASACYNNLKANIDSFMDKRNYDSGCRELFKVITCINTLTAADGCDDGNTERQAILQGAISDQGGICSSDGTVQPCGDDLKECLEDVKLIRSMDKSKNLTLACPTFHKFTSCTQSIKDSTECSVAVDQYLVKLQRVYKEVELLANCDGPCDKAVGLCLKDVEAFTTQKFMNNQLKTYCKDTYSAIQCMETLGQNGACSNITVDVMNAKAAADSLRSVISDICLPNGEMASCAKDFLECLDNLKSLTNESTVEEHCSAANKYVNCIALTPCQGTLRKFLDQNSQNLETDEMRSNCPLIGTCKQRADQCGNSRLAAEIAHPDLDIKKYCSQLKNTQVCFSVIEKDPLCSLEGETLKLVDAQIKNITKTCGGNMMQLSLLLLLISVIASLRSFA